MFKTKYDAHERIFCVHGSRLRPHFSSRFDSRGNLYLQEDGVIDDYAAIQSHADSVDIHKIWDRFVAGEEDILSKVQGFYADFSNMPSTYQEILNAVISAEETFNSLSADVKDKFGHSFQSWLISLGTPEHYQKMGITQEQISSAVSSLASASAVESDDSSTSSAGGDVS